MLDYLVSCTLSSLHLKYIYFFNFYFNLSMWASLKEGYTSWESGKVILHQLFGYDNDQMSGNNVKLNGSW
jgi:hypothetical protein